MSASSWDRADSARLYRLDSWGAQYFDIDEQGHLCLALEQGRVDLHALCAALERRGLLPPVLVRFPQILGARVDELAGSFQRVCRERGYTGRYRGVYPVKVNPQKPVVRELVRAMGRWHMGLECGSKPELMAAIAALTDPQALLLCNGYKDRAYVELALSARQLGLDCIITIEQYEELELVRQAARRLGITPVIGVRARLASTGDGRWSGSAGDRGKFGLGIPRLVRLVRDLEAAGELSWLRLLHFHIGSQIGDIRQIARAVREATHLYAELRRLGAPMGILDVGGGLGVDYDGTRSRTESSANYTVEEYSWTVVDTVMETLKRQGVEDHQPDLVTEAGRALVAHGSALLLPVVARRRNDWRRPSAPPAEAPWALHRLWETWEELSSVGLQESLHGARTVRDETLMRFSVGAASLEERAAVEELYFAILGAIYDRALADPSEQRAPEIAALVDSMAQVAFCNFSVFQSLPDIWAIQQVFPVMPLQRLHERPGERCTLADLTCDSDGRVDHFVSHERSSRTLPIHADDGQRYYLGVFLVGAYQEILGDLHNLFGDTHVVHITAQEGGVGYRLSEIVEGETAAEVLEAVEYEPGIFLRRLRRRVEQAHEAGVLSVEQGAALLRRCREMLGGYTYLAPDPARHESSATASAQVPSAQVAAPQVPAPQVPAPQVPQGASRGGIDSASPDSGQHSGQSSPTQQRNR